MKNAWLAVASARRDLADMVESLDPARQEGPTLCVGWTPHHVLAHVTSFVEVPLPKYLYNVARAKGDFDVAADRMARALAEHPVDELAAILRSKADKRSPVPGFAAELSLSDVIIHTQDIRRGVGAPGTVGDSTVRGVLDFLAGHKQARYLYDTRRINGLSLWATDIDWRHGDPSAPIVSGRGEALMMAITGRDTLAELAGPVDQLR
jgi:uncharacterized protein (TIGR03083 family)